MPGFVTDQPTNRTTFDDFIDSLGDALPGSDIFKFGQARGQQIQTVADLLTPVGYDIRIHRPDFYNLEYNPDDVLIQHLNAENQPALSVLVTDGVHSDFTGQGNPPVVDAIRGWMEQGRTFGILVLKSRFSGSLYSERQRTMLQRVFVRARPFYALVFSPTLQEFNELKEKVQRRFPEVSIILFTDEAMTCEVRISAHAEITYSFATTPFYWHMLKADVFSPKRSGDELVYEVTYKSDPDYPVKELSYSPAVSYYLWKSGKLEKTVTTPPTGFSCEVSEGQLRPKLVTDTRSDHGFYQIRLNPSVRFLRDDILALSTRDDGDLNAAEKTYKFYELIMALTDIHLKSRLANRVSPTLYLTVANK